MFPPCALFCPQIPPELRLDLPSSSQQLSPLPPSERGRFLPLESPGAKAARWWGTGKKKRKGWGKGKERVGPYCSNPPTTEKLLWNTVGREGKGERSHPPSKILTTKNLFPTLIIFLFSLSRFFIISLNFSHQSVPPKNYSALSPIGFWKIYLDPPGVRHFESPQTPLNPLKSCDLFKRLGVGPLKYFWMYSNFSSISVREEGL